MLKTIGTLICLLLLQTVTAQTLTGKVTDTTNTHTLTNATVTLIAVKDSVLTAYTRIKSDGTYTITKPVKGNYTLLITHPKFADYIDTIEITDATNELKTAYLLTKKRVLEQIIVMAIQSPIKIKGDTTIYTADSFKVRDGANVEELLKKLPGIQVGRNGEIKAMGETVKKVLVDGEEFFGNDPGVALKNLQANIVDKVEVFDKKSDQATFTGIDDGVKDKTINLKLKDNKKNGYFGKIEGSGGLPDNYSNQAMINAFKGKRKLAAFGIMSNAGRTGLGWDESKTYGGDGNSNMSMSEDGGMMWSNNNNDEFEDTYAGNGDGIPTNWNGGLHYSNKMNNDKQSVNFGYRYNKLNTNAESNTFSKTFLPDSTWSDRNNGSSFTSKYRNSVNGLFETKIDSLNTIKVTLKTNETKSSINSRSNSETFTTVNPINNSTRTNITNSTNATTVGTLLWLHKFAKKRRTLSVNLSKSFSQRNSDGFLYSLNKFYRNGNLFSNDTIDQAKIKEIANNVFSTKLSYTEPLSKKWTAELSYAYGYNYNDNNSRSLNKDASGKYNTIAAEFSNYFTLKNNLHTPGVNLTYSYKKIGVNFGAKAGVNAFTQLNNTTNFTRSYTFTNLFPSASLSIKMKKNANFRFNYNGNTAAPSLNDLQPIQDNTNPFYIVTGNPLLRQSFANSFNVNFNKYNVLKNSGMYLFAGINTHKNDFTNFSNIDSFGRTISKTINVNGNYDAELYSNFNFKLKKIGLNVGLGPQLNYIKNNNFINGFANTNTTVIYGLSLQINKWKENKSGENLYSIWGYANFNNNENKATINTNSTAKFRSITGNANFSCLLFKKTHLNNDWNYEVRQKDPRFPQNNNFMLWNIGLDREIIKNTFTIAASLNDVLNQNRGFRRSFTSYTFTENYYNTLRRYWMLTLTYKFNSQKTKAKKDETINVKK